VASLLGNLKKVYFLVLENTKGELSIEFSVFVCTLGE